MVVLVITCSANLGTCSITSAKLWGGSLHWLKHGFWRCGLNLIQIMYTSLCYEESLPRMYMVP